MRRQALTALEADSRAAQAQYETHPTDAGALLQWRQAHHTLQQLNAGASQAAALQAGVVWQHYGEQRHLLILPSSPGAPRADRHCAAWHTRAAWAHHT